MAGTMAQWLCGPVRHYQPLANRQPSAMPVAAKMMPDRYIRLVALCFSVTAAFEGITNDNGGRHMVTGKHRILWDGNLS
jgi:hypothetical protein